MRFLVDAQLPPALARWLSALGHESLHVADIGMQSASDRAIWDLAEKDGWLIITKDEDFAQRKTLTASGPQVVWLRWPNGRRADLLARFEQVLPRVIAALERGESLVEVR
ncbi:putative nuclease of predicted toxin-antitoxin system [Rhizobium sp. PP-CC-3A-592]|nr:putative nuclease of predicted toxin-antitoxin system [Rhizobium sp. PP-CC-3A-592]